ncbi:MAG: Protein kinase [Trizodia sp. TS-e1964]|nr:MAG: Protein kinase [Trizodia sp. TS-e1964]
MAMAYASAFDDEELSISLAPSANRRANNKPADVFSLVAHSQADKAKSQNPKGTEHLTQQQVDAFKLSEYTILKTLGQGSFGKVKEAIHKPSGRTVALKMITRRKLINRDMAGRVEREIQYLQLLRHPHIIKLFNVITTSTDIIMVLEYAGGELFDYIVTHGKMVEEKARTFFQQIICAVEYCHRHKIVHRDLKPENLLLDENLNVKIADFGLSNIMTDGNFLKTSCGSPNYAAPEVISGKLYAGPEVDVWSCGIILYVLLVGRLPFDDEYIPTLFKKIGNGKFNVPSYLSPGAVNIIRRMLAVNPVHRITIQEIRKDPWFMEDLAVYLHPVVEEFFHTGADPGVSSPIAVEPAKTLAVREEMHEAVLGKLGTTMGYAKDDVQEALGSNEPSAIKDAYLIVRENHLMKANPLIAENEGLRPFLAQSPPAWGENSMSPRPSVALHPIASPRVTSPMTHDLDRARQNSTAASHDLSDPLTPPSTISVLPSSLPDYHRAYMMGVPSADAGPPNDGQTDQPVVHEKSSAEQAATARRLKPHTRNQAASDTATEKVDGMTAVPPKHKKQVKWQFGIRSRNQPLEAVGCILRSLKKLGAEWVVERDEDSENESSVRGRRHRSASHSSSSSSSEENRSREGSPQHSRTHQGAHQPRGDSQEHIKDYYRLPRDPWVINCRWLKEGLLPPGVVNPSSNRSSMVNLSGAEHVRKRSSAAGSSASLSNAAANQPALEGGLSSLTDFEESVYVHMEIQLYQLEPGFWLVDFKCAGYERLIDDMEAAFSEELAHGHMDGVDGHSGASPERNAQHISNSSAPTLGRIKRPKKGVGLKKGEKELSSPFPFLDLATSLIISLSEAN